MRVAVTGATGFIGQAVVHSLRALGADVVSASRTQRPDTAGHLRLDVCNVTSWNALLDCRPDRLIHLAWDHLTDFNDPRHYLELLPAHQRFLHACASAGIGDITVAGTCLEYGAREGCLTEETATEPVTAYAIAKDALRRSMQHLSDTMPFQFKWGRIFFVRGDPGADKGVFRAIDEAGRSGAASIALTKCEQLRDYLPRNAVGGFFARFCLQDDVSGIVNCCSGNPVSMRGLVEQYALSWPALRLDFGALGYRSYEPMAFWGCRQRTDRVLRATIPAAEHDSRIEVHHGRT